MFHKIVKMLNMIPCDGHENSNGRGAPPKMGAFVACASGEGSVFGPRRSFLKGELLVIWEGIEAISVFTIMRGGENSRLVQQSLRLQTLVPASMRWFSSSPNNGYGQASLRSDRQTPQGHCINPCEPVNGFQFFARYAETLMEIGLIVPGSLMKIRFNSI